MPTDQVLYAGTGTLFKVGNAASPEVFTALAQLRMLGDLVQTRTRIGAETHNFAATQNGYDDFVLGLKKGGSIPLEMAWDPNSATHETDTLAVRALYESGAKFNAKILLGNVSPPVTLSMRGAISEIGQSFPMDNLLLMKAKFEVSGAVTKAST